MVWPSLPVAHSIVGLGIDLCNSQRLQAICHKPRGLQRIFTEQERAYAMTYTHASGQLMTYAKRFAAKEAAFKALGAGFFQAFSWKDIWVENNTWGEPHLFFSQALHTLCIQRYGGPVTPWVSLTDDAPWASAVVLLTRCFAQDDSTP